MTDPREPVEPGLYTGWKYDTYAALEGVRSSTLKHFERSAAHARYAMMNPTESAATLLGSAVHTAILEPETFEERYVVAPQLDLRTKEGKALWSALEDERPNAIRLRDKEGALCQVLGRAAWAHPLAAQLLNAKGHSEATIVWDDPATGLRCKARFDRFCMFGGHSTIVDVKTTVDASRVGFSAQVARLGYHVQAAHYLAGADVLSPVARRFIFLAIEKAPPHAVALYELDDAFLETGRAARARAMQEYKNAEETGVWPGYAAGVNTLLAPKWLTAEAPEKPDFMDDEETKDE